MSIIEVKHFPVEKTHCSTTGAFYAVIFILYVPCHKSDSDHIQKFTISDWNWKTHKILKQDTTYESMKKVLMEKVIVTNSFIIINNTEKDKYGNIKISRDLFNKSKLVVEINYLRPTIVNVGYYSPTHLFPAQRVEKIEYSDDLKKLFDFIPFMK